MTPAEELRVLKTLVESSGWRWLEGVANQQVTGRRDAHELKEITGVDALVAKEFPRGEISGIRLFIELPRARIAALETQLDSEETEDAIPD